MSEDGSLDRRTLIAGTGAAGVLALAGCLDVEEEDTDNESEETSSEPDYSVSTPPALEGNPAELNPVDRFIVESLAWQNEVLQTELES